MAVIRSSQLRTRIVPERTHMHHRVRWVFALLLFGYALLAAHLFYLQVHRHDFYVKAANAIRLRTMPVSAQRGTVYDCNGKALAMSIPVGDVIADPKAITNPEATAEAIADCIPGVNAPDLADQIQQAQEKKTPQNTPIRYLPLLKNVPYPEIRALQAQADAEKAIRDKTITAPLALAGISTPVRTARSYPNGDLAAQVLGFLSGDKNVLHGQYGVERAWDALLSGRDGQVTAELDAAHHIIPGTDQNDLPVRNGQDITLTLDSRLQAIAQEELQKSVSLHHAQSGSVVILDPRDGGILALANLPIYDPNVLQKTNSKQWSDRAVSDLYEPGSTLKTLTMAAVLDHEGLQAEHDRVFCNGVMKIGNRTIHCANDPPKYGRHGDEDMRDVLRYSCNIGAAKYAMRLGSETLYQYEKAFGLMERPNCGLPSAQYAHLADPARAKWSPIRLANVAFGQGISVTALQLASVYATLANHGQRVYPHILRDQPPGPPVQVVKPEVAAETLSLLKSVVTEGTGQPAQISDYQVGGKTGSAQVVDNKRYGDEYIGSFCGVAPLSCPRLVVLCVINRPVGTHWGAVVAAPVVHNILKRGLWYLKVPPDAPGQLDANDKKQRLAVEKASEQEARQARRERVG